MGRGAITLVLGVWACSEPAPLKDAPTVLLAGCASVRPGPVCVGAQGEVVVWVPLAEGEQVAGGEPVAGGARLRVRPEAPVIIDIVGRKPAQVRFEATDASAGRAAHEAGRAANRAGLGDEALARLDQAIELQSADGDASGAALSAELLAYVLQQRGRLAEARLALQRARPPEADGAGRAMHAYFSALGARAGGDTRGALQSFDEATLLAARLDLPLAPILVEERAMTYLAIGRVAEAVTTLEGLATKELVPCKLGYSLTNLGWALLASSRAGEASTGDVLARAQAAWAGCESTTPNMRANASLNRALWALRAGHLDLAKTLAAVPLDPTVRPDVQAWTLYVRARLAPEPAQQAEALEAVAGRAAATGFEDLRWRALLDAGLARQAAGQGAAGVARFAEAEALVDAHAFDIPVDAGRGAYAADRRESSARLVAGRLALGQTEAAMDAARQARRRVLTSLPTDRAVAGLSPTARAEWEGALQRYREARDALSRDAAEDWGRSGAALAAAQANRAAQVKTLRALLDEAVEHLGRGTPSTALRPPAAGEVLLIWSQAMDGRWTAFARDAAGTVAAEVVPPQWTAAKSLEDRIAAATTVRVLAAGPMAEAELKLGKPAVYALDLPPAPEMAVGAAGPVLLVADPTGDLPAARAEADRVAPLLPTGDQPLRRLVAAEVTRATLAGALAEVGHVHYAGHGRYAGFEGWDSALPVHDGALELADLLLLPHVPATVVLSGCETGRSAEASAAGLGLAHAFLVRGTRAVIAPVGPVDDTVAADFAVALYRALPAAGTLEAAFRAVGVHSGGNQYRIFVP